MLFGIFFAWWRFSEIVTLVRSPHLPLLPSAHLTPHQIPVVGMLSYFVHLYVTANALTPDAILVLFIVSVLAVVWAIGTLFTYHRSKENSRFVAFVDLLFVGAFIGGVVALRGIAGDNCAKLSQGKSYTADFGLLGSVEYGGLGIKMSKTCGMLKASWAFGIMNCLFFFITSMLACMVGGGKKEEKEAYVREAHTSRHGHRSNSHRSHRSSHSGRHAYV